MNFMLLLYSFFRLYAILWNSLIELSEILQIALEECFIMPENLQFALHPEHQILYFNWWRNLFPLASVRCQSLRSKFLYCKICKSQITWLLWWECSAWYHLVWLFSQRDRHQSLSNTISPIALCKGSSVLGEKRCAVPPLSLSIPSS